MTDIDPILDARLDLLDQVLMEVKDIQEVIEDQKARLDALDAFLMHKGRLFMLRNQAILRVGDARQRVRLAIDSHDGEDLGREDMGEDGEQEPDQLVEAGKFLDQLFELVNTTLETERRKAHRQLAGLRDWSVAALDEGQLDPAMKLFEDSLNAIRDSSEPWLKYEEQLRAKGERLLSAYFELLGSMAVRGLNQEDELATSRETLLRLLMKPCGRKAPQLATPNLLTRSEHVQLGYGKWSLWAMPLMGREVGQHIVAQDTFRFPVPKHQEVVCADAYASYVLGPSYVAASLFLELDPDGEATNGDMADPVRAELLLELLPDLAPPPQRRSLQDFTDRLRTAWEEARVAVHAPPVDVPGEARETMAKFLTRVRTDYPEGGDSYLANLDRRVEEADSLVAGSPVGTGQPRDVLVSMWWARIHHLDAEARDIDRFARELLRPAAAASSRRTSYGARGGRP